jgi:acyl-CoA thioesterase
MTTQNSTASEIIDAMMEKDQFSQWLGVKRMEERTGYCKLKMTIRQEMCNGFGIAHGGISFSLADSALAFASNSHGRKAVSMETFIAHIKSLKTGDVIIAEAMERNAGKTIGHYDVTITRENGELVSLFRGTVFFHS